MGALSNSVSSEGLFDGLGGLEAALSQLQKMSVVIELDRAERDFDASFSAALGPKGRKQRRPKSKEADTITVNRVRSTHPWLDPWGHATISIDDDRAVGLVPNSDSSAFLGLSEDLGTGLPNYVPGRIQQDYRIPEATAVIHITVNQARAARAFIRQSEDSPQVYDFLFHNCAEWVEEVLSAAGVNTPADMTPGGLVRYLQQEYPE